VSDQGQQQRDAAFDAALQPSAPVLNESQLGTKLDRDTQTFNKTNEEVLAPSPKPTGPSNWEEAGLVLEDLKNNTVGVGKGFISGNLGTAVDLLAMAEMVGYEGFRWMKTRGKDPFRWTDVMDVPGGTDSIGETVFKADVHSPGFIVGSLFSPGGVVKGLGTIPKVAAGVAAVKSMVVGGRVATRALTGTLDTAKGMSKVGKSDIDVWQETGWWKTGKQDKAGADIYKYVLSDADSVVNSEKLTALARAQGIKKGDSGVIRGTLDELFTHPTLFEAYPQLRNVPITFNVNRIEDTVDGASNYRVFNKVAEDSGLMGQTRTTRRGKTVDILTDLDDDLGRSTILHEIQHLVQEIEGFDQGASVKRFMTRIFDVKQSELDKVITSDLASGVAERFADEAAYAKYVREVSDKTKVHIDNVEDTLEQFMRSNVDIEDAVIVAGAEARRTMRDLRFMVEEVSVGMPEDAQIELAEALAEGLNAGQARWLARERYNRQAGEVEARLTQINRNRTQTEIDNLRELGVRPTSPEVPEASQITGDLARDGA